MVVLHRTGVTSFERTARELRQQLDVFVFPSEPVKASRLTLTNTSRRSRTFSVYSYNEWVLGPPRMGHQRHVVTGRDAPAAIVDVADTVTEMRKVKHAYDTGVRAKKGIDY